MVMLSDHQDSNHFSYERQWDEIEHMLDKAERKMNHHYAIFMGNKKQLTFKEKRDHAANYKALQGVVKTLRWTLGDKNVTHPLE